MAENTHKSDLGASPAEPHPLFAAWYTEAERCEEIKYAHAMCLSTVDPDGFPDARTVLLKSFDATGYVFFTDTESSKGEQLARLPRAALTFYWGPLDRQIRIRGSVEPTSDEVSDECFHKRPRGSQITAWACRQSRILKSRDELDNRVRSFIEKFAGQDTLLRPPNWRAYRVVPESVEFWQARVNRRHDRLLYEKGAQEDWQKSWLYP